MVITARDTKLKPGFKQTEVGVIPEDWEVALLDSVAKRGSGHTPDKKHPEYWDGEIKWISLKDSDRLDALYINETAARITPAGIANSSAILHPAGTVVLSRDAGVGKSAITMDMMAVSQHFMAWQCGPRLDNHFLYYWLQAEKPEFERIAFGNTIKTIGLPYFKKLEIPLPTFNEQQAIATALRDVDALIMSLDKLIAKKRDIKQATMQQLLTGKKRLPGFNGEWKAKRLEEVSKIESGINKPLSLIGKSGTKYVTVLELYEGSNILVDKANRIQISESEIKQYSLQRGDIVFGKSSVKREGIGFPNIFVGYKEPVVFSGFTFRARINRELADPFFIIHELRMSNTRNWLINNSQASALTNINQAIANKIPLFIPSDREEQTAIAAILTDMDAEIAALEQKRDKTRALKQGMMQELLTGKTRLV